MLLLTDPHCKQKDGSNRYYYYSHSTEGKMEVQRTKSKLPKFVELWRKSHPGFSLWPVNFPALWPWLFRQLRVTHLPLHCGSQTWPAQARTPGEDVRELNQWLLCLKMLPRSLCGWTEKEQKQWGKGWNWQHMALHFWNPLPCKAWLGKARWPCAPFPWDSHKRGWRAGITRHSAFFILKSILAHTVNHIVTLHTGASVS